MSKHIAPLTSFCTGLVVNRLNLCSLALIPSAIKLPGALWALLEVACNFQTSGKWIPLPKAPVVKSAEVTMGWGLHSSRPGPVQTTAK